MRATREQVEAIAASVLDASILVHRELGAGLLESVYQTCLAQELRDRGRGVECELSLPIRYRGRSIEAGFRLDMLVDGEVVVENKAVQAILPVHYSQLLTYLRLSGHRLGFLINWNVPLLKDGVTRLVNRL